MSALLQLLASMHAEEHVPLARFSTMKVGGPARYFVQPDSLDDVANLSTAAFEYGMPLHILSGGSNTLFSDEGFPGIVMKLSQRFDSITSRSCGLFMTVGAATSFAKICKLAVSYGWARAVGWSGTPGLVGGALRMNAGTRMGEISDVVVAVRGVHKGRVIEYKKSDLQFSYRQSSMPLDFIICEADLACDVEAVQSSDELLQKLQEYRRRRRATQPIVNSLGSFFKNPYPDFAAQLIEKCSLKGMQHNGAQISPLHANFIVNNGGACAEDILYIAKAAQRRVREEFGVTLIPEIRMVGFSNE